MTDTNTLLDVLQRIEQHQLRALELQSEQIALHRAQIARTEARVEESIALQQLAVTRQARAMAILLPVIVMLVAFGAYLVFR